ncbi:unnamed protein product [Cyclocybe aegerita]|uniref:SH3 domain-containing protein n=1 Tax=Cyclocybe aegerita TaxID=1973307 RepID=A0A8S0WTI1_CYCAE|nr:unnamed protein product [Cyclocybe aegerita]
MIDQRTTLHRMVRVKQARAPGPAPLTLDFRTVTAMQIQTETIVLQPSSASAKADASFMIPKTTLVLAIIIACLSLALILLIVIVLYRRHHQRKNKQTTESRSNAFDSDSFVEKRRSLDKERFGSDEKRSLQSPNTPSTASSRTPIVGWRTPNSATPLRVTNDEGSESEYEEDKDPSRRYTADTIEGAYSSQPIRLTEFAAKEKAKRKADKKASDFSSAPQPSVAGLKLKTKFKSKSRPSWLKPVTTTGQNQTQRTEDTGRSPPPAYAVAAATSQGYQSPHLVPIPPLLPPQKSRYNMEVPPPTPPASRKSHASSGTAVTSEQAPESGQFLTVKNDEPAPVLSPARSESFAPKDLVAPPAPVHSPPWSAKLSPPNSALSDSSLGTPTTPNGTRAPRLMNVVAPFVPTLPDELRVKVGDTVRVLQTYRDGWCFVQFVGKADAPKGVVPIVCLRDRQRFVVHKGKGGVGGMGSLGGSKGSISSLNMGWR